MSIRKIKTKSNELRWEVYLSSNGRSSRLLRRRFDTKIEAETFIHEYKVKQREGKLPYSLKGGSFEETTFKDEATFWTEQKSGQFSPAYNKRVEGILKELLPKYGRLTPDKLQPELISSYQKARLSTGVRPATVNKETAVLNAILNFSSRCRRIPFNPLKGFQKLKETHCEMQVWDREEAASFLSFVSCKYPHGSEKRWVYIVYLLAINTGLRAGEIWGLMPKDIMHDRERLYISRQLDLMSGELRLPKGGKTRYVPCNDQLLEELTSLITSCDVASDRTIFRSAKGCHVDHHNFINRIFLQDVREWEGKKIRFHDLRHTATTLMLQSGVPIKDVQMICGHSNITTTSNYLHLTGDSIKQAAKKYVVTPSAAPRNPALRLVRGVK